MANRKGTNANKASKARPATAGNTGTNTGGKNRAAKKGNQASRRTTQTAGG